MKILDLRTYTIQVGRLGEYVQFYQNEGLPAQSRHQGEPVGYFVTEVGTLNQAVHMWGYASMAEREERRINLEKDPEWIAYRKKSAKLGLIVSQENKLLKASALPTLLNKQ